MLHYVDYYQLFFTKRILIMLLFIVFRERLIIGHGSLIIGEIGCFCTILHTAQSKYRVFQKKQCTRNVLITQRKKTHRNFIVHCFFWNTLYKVLSYSALNITMELYWHQWTKDSRSVLCVVI